MKRWCYSYSVWGLSLTHLGSIYSVVNCADRRVKTGSFLATQDLVNQGAKLYVNMKLDYTEIEIFKRNIFVCN